ncbi:MAG: hypothetical protein ACJATF_000312 [Flavobacteriales bacterium]|jgi:hypothetical protein
MRWRILCFLIVLISLQSGYSQQIKLQFQLIDEGSGNPISDAHVFISGASIGTTSNHQGICEISISAQETQALLISHISYESLTIHPEQYPLLIDAVAVKMKGNGIDLSEIQFTAKRTSKWKKNYRRFKKALLGEGLAASKCKILNPGVLRFEKKNGKLSVSAIDLLQIDNNYLGYNIQFWLEDLSIKADGSKFYKGSGQFIDKQDVNNVQKKRREQVYQNSLAHFLSSLLVSRDKASLKNNGYQISIERYNQGKFTKITTPDPQDLIKADSILGFYQLHFSDFLTIKHNNLNDNSAAGFEIAISGAEQQKFGTNSSVSTRIGEQVAISRLYKISPFLVFDIRGNIINKSAVREYDYWANQRLATTLPIDYKEFSDFNIERPRTKSIDTLLVFKNLIGSDQQKKEQAINFLQNNWSYNYIAPLLDILRLNNSDWHEKQIRALLQKHVPEIEPAYFEGSQWLWKSDPNYGSYYANFKALQYGAIDTAFYQYFFGRGQKSKIRLDEIVWGGVRQNGIPPLRKPKMLNAIQAKYLSDTDVVFGLVINGSAYAYPKRILAWHEFFTDDIKGQSIAGVYCTLCGTLIIYNTEFNGVKHDLGTSGFLYRSNKLMYDRATQSLWSTILGQPVMGPLVDQNIELSTLPVETTNWGEWLRRHPDTQVLSLETGHDRNYGEGEAYKEYYANDLLIFPVPEQDKRLPNKARIFIPRPKEYTKYPLAVSVDYLKRKGIHQDQMGKQSILIITESNGASRAYAIDDQEFKSYKQGKLLDKERQIWAVTEAALIGPDGQRFFRLPAHEAFWFAWFNVFPTTRIVY